MLRRFARGAPYSSGTEVRAALAASVTTVEDEHSGIPENPDAHLTRTSDGRMYPPHEIYEYDSGCPAIRAFRQRAHRTFFGENGAARIERIDGTSEIDLPGSDGKTIADLRVENPSEAN